MFNLLKAAAAAGAAVSVVRSARKQEPVCVAYSVTSGKVRSRIRIAVVADLHCTRYGDRQEKLADLVRTQQPDFALFPGDTDDGRLGPEPAYDAVRAVSQICPVYLILGNHEVWYRTEFNCARAFETAGARVLNPGHDVFTSDDGDRVRILGIPDWYRFKNTRPKFERELEVLAAHAQPDMLNILLSHQPEIAGLYFSYPFDIAVSGHAHGGQWRLPGMENGVFAPDQGILPRYTGGIYRFPGGTLVVSRGLAQANTVIPRIMNPPELTVLDILPG